MNCSTPSSIDFKGTPTFSKKKNFKFLNLNWNLNNIKRKSRTLDKLDKYWKNDWISMEVLNKNTKKQRKFLRILLC